MRQVVIPKCGHAPQIEKPRLVNHLISRYLRDKLRTIPPALEPSRFLEPARGARESSGRPIRNVLEVSTQPMNDFALFLGKFLRHGTAIASVAPSSRWLSQTTVRNIDWAKARALVELGAGTGPITRVIAAHAAAHCRVIVVERDPDFARLLRERFQERPNFEIVEGDVRDLAEILADRGDRPRRPRCLGLAGPSFPRALQQCAFSGRRQGVAERWDI